MVEHDLAKVETGVRFSYAALKISVAHFYACIANKLLYLRENRIGVAEPVPTSLRGGGSVTDSPAVSNLLVGFLGVEA